MLKAKWSALVPGKMQYYRAILPQIRNLEVCATLGDKFTIGREVAHFDRYTIRHLLTPGNH
jgi:hypothetical protein